MAFYVLQSCTVRKMTARSALMMHQVTLVDVELNMSNIRVFEKRMMMYNNGIVKQLARRLKISEAEIAKNIQTDWWMDSAEALSVGAIDSIVN